MKNIYVTDAQFVALKKIAVSHDVRISSLVQIAVDMVFRPVVINRLDIPFINKSNKS